MQIQVLYFEGCPNWQVLATSLQEILSEMGSHPKIEFVEVDTPDAAEQWEFRGSPTILIDGSDPFLDNAASVGLSCRIYRTPDGFAGAPTREQLRVVVEAAR